MNGREDLMPRDLMSREVTAAQLNAMKQRVQSDPKLAAMFSSLNTFLQASEYEVIEMMVHANIWSGPAPKNPGGSGSVEFGLFDYWLNNPGTSWEWQLFVSFWKTLAGSLPVTQMNAANYQNLKNAVQPGQPGLVAADGSWFSESTYGGLDPGWVEAAFDYLCTYGGYLGFTFAPFAQTPPTVTLSGASPSQVTIALMGDWGTGNYTNGPAASVMQAIAALKPDYIIHLGDVYYAGSIGEETNNLLGMWPATYAGKSFTLNSNHEMYNGANGYYSALGQQYFQPAKRHQLLRLAIWRYPAAGRPVDHHRSGFRILVQLAFDYERQHCGVLQRTFRRHGANFVPERFGEQRAGAAKHHRPHPP